MTDDTGDDLLDAAERFIARAEAEPHLRRHKKPLRGVIRTLKATGDRPDLLDRARAALAACVAHTGTGSRPA